MKVAWSANDIKAGLRISKPGCGETWIIGYMTKKSSKSLADKWDYVMVSLSDGLVTTGMTKESLAELLTGEGYIPEDLLTKYSWGEKV